MANFHQSKFQTVIEKNTFYFYNAAFQEKYEGHINSIKETLLVLKNEVETQGLKKEIFESLLKNKTNGLRALLALTGFSNEYLKRLITVLRVADNKELSELLYRDKWIDIPAATELIKLELDLETVEIPDDVKAVINNIEIKEWADSKIEKLIKDSEFFRKGVINLFFEGSTIPFLASTMPLFELKKLSISKLNFEIPAMIDTLVRYKEKGSYSAQSGNNPESVIKELLLEANLTYETGDLTELILNEQVAKRTMDFIIPNKKIPEIIIESSFLVTTSSGQGDKSKTEGSIKALISKYYPNAKFVGFVDGIGWYVRKADLFRMITAYDEVFTFHKSELERFKNYLITNLKND